MRLLGTNTPGLVARLLLLAALAATVAACGDKRDGARAESRRYSVEIRRTAYGIPHILANDYGSLGYGYGYAFAHDNLCVMADRAVTLRSERSRYFGPTADAKDPFADAERASSNLASDVYYRGLRQSGVVRRLLARPAPLGPTARLRRMVDGYVAGYNRYLRDTGVARLPDPSCRGKAWVGPITALDVWSSIYDFNALEGTAQFRDAIVSARPPAAGAPARALAATIPAGPPADTGSNGWALGRDATRARDGMLFANPHLPWAGHARFYQVQLTIPGVLDVAGASVYGTPVVEIGHTRGVAWTHTTSTAQRYTIFQLDLVPGKPTSYRVDGRTVAMSRQKVTVSVRGADGELSTVRRTLYGSRYGPVLATGWTAKTAFAVRDANADNLRSTNEWLAMGTAQNIAQLRAAQDAYQGIPFTNTLAVDASGTAYFADASVVPHVTDAHAARCIDTAEGKARYPETFVLDGSRSACNWGNDPGAVQRGIFAPSHVPRLTRTDYVANSNDSPWLTNPAAAITGYPAIFGDTGTERTLRTRLGLDMIAQRLAGSDGLGRPGFTLRTLQAATLGNRNYSADLGRRDVVAMCRAHPVLTAGDGTRVDVRAACGTLARWDGRADVGSRGEQLWETFFHGGDRESWWRVPFDPAHPLTTPRAIDRSNTDVQRALADAVQILERNRTARSPKRWAGITLPGCADEKGCFNVIEAAASTWPQIIRPRPGQTGPQTGPPPRHTAPPPDRRHQRPGGKPPAIFGSSFIMAVELTPDGPRGRTILTYSQSANPASRHYSDQTVLFSRKRWVPERFTEAEISADPHLQTTTLRG
jgi:acyl-homoserine-lactone acylase